LWKEYGFSKQKTLKLPFQFFFCFENPYSFLDLILWVQIIALEKWCLTGINVVSDGLHSQNQCIIIPSVGGSSSKQGYCFFICLVGGIDCVCEKVDAIDFNQR
jgi:hypothetical protein